MSNRAKRKAAIDCTGYLCEMKDAKDLILAGLVPDNLVDEYNRVKAEQEALWLPLRDRILAVRDDDDDADDD